MDQREDLKEVTDFKEVNPANIKEVPQGVELLVGDIRDFDTSLPAWKGIFAANIEPFMKNLRMEGRK